MKLLYCIPALYNAGGMERVLTEKVNYLVNFMGYEITIVTTDQYPTQTTRFLLDSRIRLIHLGIHFEAHFNAFLVKKYFVHKYKLRKYRFQLVNLITELDVDICISLCGKEIDFLDKLKVNCKKVVEIHFGMNFRKQFLNARYNGKLWRFLGNIRTRQLQNSVKGLDRLVVLTKADKTQWETVCSNVIQIKNPNPLKNMDVSSLDKKRVISIGRLDPQKGYDMLLQAWCYVAEKHPDWKLDIYGDGISKDFLISKIEELNLLGKVVLCGLTYDVASNLLDSSIYVMSSRYEGLPMVLIEAMSCGLPVVSFDCECGPREIITDGVDGYLVEPNNVRLLADRISYLIEKEQLRKRIGRKAIEKSKEYSIDRIMQHWVILFEQLMNC